MDCAERLSSDVNELTRLCSGKQPRMKCRSVRLLIAPYVLEDPALTSAEHAQVEAHLAVCWACEQEVFETAQLIGILRSMRLSSPADASVTISHESHSTNRPTYRRYRWKRLAGAVLGLAACVAICAAMGMWKYRRAGANASNPEAASWSSSQLSGTVVSADLEGRELARHPLPVGRELAASRGERLCVRIWNRHEVMMEPGTRLSLDGCIETGCRVHLEQGRIVVSVSRASHEGHFKIHTSKAVLTVIGTVFEVESTPRKTVLAVVHGTVDMATVAGDMQRVSAGQKVATDGCRLVRVEHSSASDPVNMFSWIAGDAADELAGLRKSPWYQQRFTPVLRLRDYLLARGEQADELSLIAISADMWAVQRPKTTGAKIPYLHRKAGLVRAARLHGYEVEWLTAGDAVQAERLARQGLAERHLVLAYGAYGATQPVVAIDDDALSRGTIKSLGAYRFLGDRREATYTLAIIKPANSKPTAALLAREALLDMQMLLTGTQDDEYLVGQDALNMWVAQAQSMDMPPWDDGTFVSLQALGKLASVCQHSYSAMGVPVDLKHWIRLTDAVIAAPEDSNKTTQPSCAHVQAIDWQNHREALIRSAIHLTTRQCEASTRGSESFMRKR